MAAAARLILLTGATGFVGRQVLRALGERGVKVRVVIRDGTQARLEHSEAIESIVATPDLFKEDAGWWRNACDGVDTVVHAAWYAEPGIYLQSPKNAACRDGTKRLAQGARDARVRRFVGIGTCFEYEASDGRLSTATPLKPATPYATAKVETFRALSHFLPVHDIEFSWCRLFFLYGDGEDARRLVPYLRARLSAGEPAELTSGTQVRDYLDVREAGRMIADVALGTAQGAVNICSGNAVTIRALAERIADDYGRRDLLRFGARPDNAAEPPCLVGIPGRRE
jgi:dTDP-6-deoxy-L-talose 4-dehydrogenase (NAD+)